MQLRLPNGLLLALGAAAFGLIYAISNAFLPLELSALLLLGGCLAVLCMHNPLLAIVLLVIAMLFSPEFHLGDSIIIRLEDAILPFLCIGLFAREISQGWTFRRSMLDLPMAAVVGVCLLSGWLGSLDDRVELQSTLLWSAKVLEMFLVYWATLHVLQSPRQVRLLMGLVFLVFLAVSIYASTMISTTEVHSANRLTAPFEQTAEPTTLGGYMTLICGIMMAIALYETRPAPQILYWVFSGLTLIPIIYTFSRTTYASFTVMILLLGILSKRAWLIASSVAAILLLAAFAPQSAVERVLSTFDSTRLHGLDPSLWERIHVWTKAGHTLRHHPLLGQGFPQPILDSQFARIIIESGLLGLLAWGSVLAACARLGRALMRQASTGLHKGIAVGYLVGLAAMLVHSLATTTFYIVRIMMPFWLLTGVVAFLLRYEREQRRANQMEPGDTEEEPACAASAV